MRDVRGLVLLCLAVSASLGVAASEVPGTITILEGEAVIVRGANQFRAAEGVRLAHGDILETAKGAFVQVELVDQAVLQMGGVGQVMVGGSSRQKADRTLYAMSGWFKLSSARKEGGARGFEIRSPLFEIAALPAVAVIRIKPEELALFAERGDVRLVERNRGVSSATATIRSGHYYRRSAGARGASGATALAGFVAEMPKPFLDSLPLRAARFKDREVVPKPGAELTYNDIQEWLQAEAPFRRQFVERFRSKTREPAFRAALIANLNSHYEWDPILFPEKYLPKEPVPAASAASGSGALVPRTKP